MSATIKGHLMNIHLWLGIPILRYQKINNYSSLDGTSGSKSIIKRFKLLSAGMIHFWRQIAASAYQLLFSYFGEQRDYLKKSDALAASIELLHTAALVHDAVCRWRLMRASWLCQHCVRAFGILTAVYRRLSFCLLFQALI